MACRQGARFLAYDYDILRVWCVAGRSSARKSRRRFTGIAFNTAEVRFRACSYEVAMATSGFRMWAVINQGRRSLQRVD